MFARRVSDRYGQPAVLGELLLGIVLGNVGYWLGHPLFVLVMHAGSVETLYQQVWGKSRAINSAGDESIGYAIQEFPEELAEVISSPLAPDYVTAVLSLAVIAHLGVLVLLFVAGLESEVRRMFRVWRSASLVALVGMAAPFALGFSICYLLHPSMTMTGHLFLAATLAATSVGITARVFADLKQLHTSEADVILGAAVIDDILGLVLLAVVVGIASTGSIDPLAIGKTVLIAGMFLGLILTLGEYATTWGAKVAIRLDYQHSTLFFPLGMMFSTAWFADAIQLAPIVGAFAAGLIIKESQFPSDSKVPTIAHQFAPIEQFLAPVFFLFVGMQVNIGYFFNWSTLLLALTFTISAIIGKLVAGLVANHELDRLTIGLGMVPRGEVGLIFISVGRGLGIVSDSLFSALVVVVIVTTLITPPALKWSLSRNS